MDQDLPNPLHPCLCWDSSTSMSNWLISSSRLDHYHCPSLPFSFIISSCLLQVKVLRLALISWCNRHNFLFLEINSLSLSHLIIFFRFPYPCQIFWRIFCFNSLGCWFFITGLKLSFLKSHIFLLFSLILADTISSPFFPFAFAALMNRLRRETRNRENFFSFALTVSLSSKFFFKVYARV